MQPARPVITHIDTACVLIEINGYRILTDPALDAAGKWYYHGSGSVSKKTGDPAIDPKELPAIDLVLLSHHQHKDNFDHAGQAFTRHVPLVLSTPAAEKAVTGVRGLKPWESMAVRDNRLPGLKVTAVPAQHHPWWVPAFLIGQVTGFIIEYDAQDAGVMYISGDTVFFDGIRAIASRFTIDIAVIHLGSVEFRYLTGFGRYTMNARDLLRTSRILNANILVPVHYKGWSHFRETEKQLRDFINADPALSAKTLVLEPGNPTLLP